MSPQSTSPAATMPTRLLLCISYLSILHLSSGLEVVIHYSFYLPDQLGIATPESAKCCSFGVLPDNDTHYMVPPTVFGIGTQKGGTTTLYKHLSRHPQMHEAKKEMHFLDSGENKSYEAYLSAWKWNQKGHRRLVVQNNSLHEEVVPPTEGALFEISPSYMFVPFAACRAKVIAPSAKIIVFLRDPATRAYSGFAHTSHVVFENQKAVMPWMRRSYWSILREGILDIEKEPTCDFQTGRGLYSYNDCVGCMLRRSDIEKSCDYLDFVTEINAEGGYKCNSLGKQILLRGMYGAQLAWWFTLMHPSQFKIINSQDFFEHPLKVMKSVGTFLDLHPRYTAKMLHASEEKANVGHYQKQSPVMSNYANSVLREYYTRPNLELYRLLHETGHGDFRPFEENLQNQEFLNCSDGSIAESGICGDARFLKPDKYLDFAERLPKRVWQEVHPSARKKNKVSSTSMIKSEEASPKTTLQPEIWKSIYQSIKQNRVEITRATGLEESPSTINVVVEPQTVVYQSSMHVELYDHRLLAVFGFILAGFLMYGIFMRKPHPVRIENL